MGEVTLSVGPVHAVLTPPIHLNPATAGIVAKLTSSAPIPAGSVHASLCSGVETTTFGKLNTMMQKPTTTMPPWRWKLDEAQHVD